jgi:hypothetical protein
VTITLGDQAHGSPGIRAQTFQESAHEFRMLVDPTNACVVRNLPTSPRFPILADRAVSVICLVPSQALVGEPVDIHLRGVDRWGNPAPLSGSIALAWRGTGDVRFGNRTLTFERPGSGYLMVQVDGLTGRSNPITACAGRPSLLRFWGDLHAQSDATVGTGTEEEYFAFARDEAWLDFCGHQGNDFQVTDEDWARLNRTVEAYHQDGRFVVFPGYEWSGNTTAGGDHNVIYRQEGLPIMRSSHWQIPDTPEDALTPAHPAGVLFERLQRQVGHENVVVAAHVGGRYADVKRYFDPGLCNLVEVVSCWGIFEWLLWDSLQSGHIVGVTCNSDGHKGRPGAEGPGAGEFGTANGLTCVLASELSRKAVFQALQERRCYGTTGPRIDLRFEMDGQPMGVLLPWRKQVRVHASVVGTAPLESLTLYQGLELIHQVRPAAFRSLADSRRLRVSWGGARMRGRGRRAIWDGSIHLDDARLESVNPFAFDALTDGVVGWDAEHLAFRSRTTGDRDGVDLWLNQATHGRLTFDSPLGSCRIDLADLIGASSRHVFDFGGLGLHVCVERYPEHPTDLAAALDIQVQPPEGGPTPYLIKVVQVDGHMAWSSPIYVLTA